MQTRMLCSSQGHMADRDATILMHLVLLLLLKLNKGVPAYVRAANITRRCLLASAEDRARWTATSSKRASRQRVAEGGVDDYFQVPCRRPGAKEAPWLRPFVVGSLSKCLIRLCRREAPCEMGAEAGRWCARGAPKRLGGLAAWRAIRCFCCFFSCAGALSG